MQISLVVFLPIFKIWIIRNVLVISVELNIIIAHEPIHIVTILGAGFSSGLDSTTGVNQEPTTLSRIGRILLSSTKTIITSQIILIAAFFSWQIECLNAIDILDISIVIIKYFYVSFVNVTSSMYQNIFIIRVSFNLLTSI